MVISQGKTGNLQAGEQRKMRGGGKKERERLPCGIKLISLLKSSSKFGVQAGEEVIHLRQELAAPPAQHHDLLGLISLTCHAGGHGHGTDTARSAPRGTAHGLYQKKTLSSNSRKYAHLSPKVSK